MKTRREIRAKIFKIQEKLIGIDWVESRKKALKVIDEMKQRQNSLSNEQVRLEAFEQVEKLKKLRIESNGER